MGALSNPFDPDSILWTGCPCGMHATMYDHQLANSQAQMGSRFYASETTGAETTEQANQQREEALHADRAQQPKVADTDPDVDWNDQEAVLARCVESAVLKGLFGTDTNRRNFLKGVGSATALAAVSQFIPLDKLKAAIVEANGPLEKTDLNVGFVPITCATPIIMASPLGFYERYGLNVDVIKTAGWAVSRDKSLSGEYDAAHMLTPMPLAITVGAGSTAVPWTMPAVENINGQAITLANKHLDKQDPSMWRGFTFGVPFEYSMHNFLLRYYVAEAGLDPDQDIQICAGSAAGDGC